MQFTIVIKETREVSAADVAELAEAERKKWELEPNANVPAYDILRAAAARGLIELPADFSMDDSEELDVTAKEIAESIADEAEG